MLFNIAVGSVVAEEGWMGRRVVAIASRTRLLPQQPQNPPELTESAETNPQIPFSDSKRCRPGSGQELHRIVFNDLTG